MKTRKIWFRFWIWKKSDKISKITSIKVNAGLDAKEKEYLMKFDMDENLYMLLEQLKNPCHRLQLRKSLAVIYNV